ncbi:hypothetical protein VTL71DRAFT_539 [Oculimacula yallundae]|uniref:Uncharacterized protein n=1 Tax=Oculimacula yallundae TaxID=86028 RepID=A0ABR4D0E0_9HELO
MPPLPTINLSIYEPIRATIEQAKRTLVSPTAAKDDREWAILDLEEIYNSAPAKNITPYHFACVCSILAVHSPAGIYARNTYARKCLAEAKKKLKKVRTDSYDMGPLRDEFSITEQIFKGLQKQATIELEKIAKEMRALRLENKLVGNTPSPSPKKVRARHVMKKKKVSWGRVKDLHEDEDGDDEGGEHDEDYEDLDGGESSNREQHSTTTRRTKEKMAGRGGPSFFDVVHGVGKALGERSTDDVIELAAQYLKYGSMNQKEIAMLLKHFYALLKLLNAEPNQLDDFQRCEILSLLATDCGFKLDDEERKSYGRQCISACKEIDEFDDKYKAAGQILRDMEKLLASLGAKTGDEMAGKDHGDLNDSHEDSKDEKKEPAIPVRPKEDKNNDNIGLWEEDEST